MGLDYNTFCKLTPREFRSIYAKWQENKNKEFKEKWEQTRFVAYWSAKNCLKPELSIENFLPFKWDNKRRSKSKRKVRDPKRFEKLKMQYGATTV